MCQNSRFISAVSVYSNDEGVCSFISINKQSLSSFTKIYFVVEVVNGGSLIKINFSY